ncbi:MAG: DUF5678 domain-containing protein [Nanoarchaeota archaeon]|nr:DUF5678 domain-containing protein [Nanoarchaeota archaeon]
MSNDMILEEFKSLEAGSSFISAKIAEFSHKYQRKFIAVKEDELIEVGDNFEEVLKKVKEKGFNPSSVLIEYIPGKEEIILY